MRQEVWPVGGQGTESGALTATAGTAARLTEEVRSVLEDCGGLAVDATALDEADDLYTAGLTSHGCVSLMLALEERFDIEFPERLLNRRTFESIAAIRDAVRSILDDSRTGTP